MSFHKNLDSGSRKSDRLVHLTFENLIGAGVSCYQIGGFEFGELEGSILTGLLGQFLIKFGNFSSVISNYFMEDTPSDILIVLFRNKLYVGDFCLNGS